MPVTTKHSGYNKRDSVWRCACHRYHKGILAVVSKKTWYRHNPGVRKRAPRIRQDGLAQLPDLETPEIEGHVGGPDNSEDLLGQDVVSCAVFRERSR